MLRLSLPVRMAFFAAGANAAGLEVSNGWIRLLPAGVPAAGYFELRNTTEAPARLVAASSPAFGTAMLHRSAEEKGHATMMHVHEIAVPSGGTLVFEPGGYHLMLMKPTRELKVGETVRVTLEFAGGSKTAARFDVLGPPGR